MNSLIRPQYRLLGLCVLLAGLTGSVATAQNKVIKQENAHPSNSWKGEDLYREFCAVCHGIDGRGRGPAAEALVQRPMDLTTIARRNSSRFPDLHIQQIIRGDGAIPAHGSEEMPTWGNVFKSISANQAFAE